jgi:serine/threonine protein kinase
MDHRTANSTSFVDDIPCIEYEKLQLIEILGTGASGEVHKALYENQIVAVKIITNNGSISFQDEIKFMKLLTHRYIVSLVGQCVYGDKQMLIMSYEDSYNLSMLLRIPFLFRTLDVKYKKMICYHIWKALEHIHSHGIYHGDVKTANIVLNSSFIAKICDLGMCGYEISAKKHLNLGTVGWNSVEKSEYANGKIPNYCGTSSDVYSMGLVCLSIFTEFDPAVDIGKIDTYKQIIDKEISDIITSCLNVDPTKRPSASDVSIAFFHMIEILPPLHWDTYLLGGAIGSERNLLYDFDRSLSVILYYINFSTEEREILKSVQEKHTNKKHRDAYKTLRNNMPEKYGWITSLYNGSLCFGDSCLKSKSTAVRIWESAKKSRAPAILNRLYYCYKDGIGVSLNNKQAVKFMITSFNQGLYPNEELATHMDLEAIEYIRDNTPYILNKIRDAIVNMSKRKDDKAVCLLAHLMFHNSFNDGTDVHDAINILNGKGNINSKKIMMFKMMYYQHTDKRLAFSICKNLAKQQVYFAQAELASMYYKGGDYVTSNKLKWIMWLNIAAKNGFRDSIITLGKLHKFGLEGVQLDDNVADSLLVVGAETGDLISMILLACDYIDWAKKIAREAVNNIDIFEKLTDEFIYRSVECVNLHYNDMKEYKSYADILITRLPTICQNNRYKHEIIRSCELVAETDSLVHILFMLKIYENNTDQDAQYWVEKLKMNK